MHACNAYGLLKGKMVRIHRIPAVAVFGDEHRIETFESVQFRSRPGTFCKGLALKPLGNREGAVSRIIRQPESLPAYFRFDIG